MRDLEHISKVLQRVMPAGSVSRGTVCPYCDCAATKIGREVSCQWCGYVTLEDSATWTIVGACKTHDGSWPEHDGRPPAGGK